MQLALVGALSARNCLGKSWYERGSAAREWLGALDLYINKAGGTMTPHLVRLKKIFETIKATADAESDELAFQELMEYFPEDD